MPIIEIIHGGSALSRTVWSDTKRMVQDQRIIKTIECPKLGDLSSFIESEAPVVELQRGYGLGYRRTEETITVDNERVKQRYITYILARR